MEEYIKKRMFELVGLFFGTDTDPAQIQPTQESVDKLEKLHQKSIVYRLNEKKELIGWVVVVPTTKKLMEDFLSKKITEKELLDLTVPAETYEALYLTSAFVLAEYRRKGYAKQMFVEAIQEISKGDKSVALFYWPFSEEGGKLASAIATKLNMDLLKREK